MGAPLASHPCPVTAGAGGLIDSGWCLDAMAPVIRGLPAWLTKETVTRPELLVHRDGRVEVYYTPFDWVNTSARIVLVGICPGRQQMLPAVLVARRVLMAGGTVAQALKAVDAAASFAGQTRSNLVRMLDRIGVHSEFGIASSASLFGEHQALADSNSLCNFTVQVNGKDYRGSSPRVDKVPFLRAYVRQVLGAALEMMPDALVVPLGKAVSTAVTMLLVNEGRLDPRRCLLGFPHPSGANNGRIAVFLQDPGDLAARVHGWFGPGARNIRSPDLARAERAPASAAPAVDLDRMEPRAALPGTPAPRPPRPHNQANVRAKTIYLAELLSSAGAGLHAARMGTVHTHGHSRRIELPPDLLVAAHSEVRLMASQSYTRLTLVTLTPSGNPQESEALLELLKQRYADALAAHLPERTQVRWHARTTADVIDFASLQLYNGGYATGDPSTAAAWVVTCCQAWVGVLRADPISQEELNSVMG